MNRLIDLVAKLEGLHAAVLGDLMLDRYVWGKAERISPEAPVPIIEVSRCSAVPGGAANVLRNIIGLNARAHAFGCLGNDPEGLELREMLQQCQTNTEGIIVDAQRPTTVKTRVLAANQQVLRIDQECKDCFEADMRRQLLEKLRRALANDDIGLLILEDYAKGLFDQQFMQEACNLARQTGCMVCLDPHPSHNFCVQGLKLMTPNRSEAFKLAAMPMSEPHENPLQDEALRQVGSNILRQWSPELLLITLGAQGMALFSDETKPPLHIATQARQVFDVSGAGDTVMTCMALALLAGASAEEAARLANAAAGVVVGYLGTTAIDAETLRQKIRET
ncbi:MAG: hypothetical protein GX901_02430 [Lentisphaerae bacterium]|nr:hypothetical protein [Lentisphaerota bacterium]